MTMFVSEVHKIALLDLRILNCDRNDGNILIKKSFFASFKVFNPTSLC